MKRLYLLRHAKSSWNDPAIEDFDRPLTARGERACRTMRRVMSKDGITPDLILCSAARRARDTLAGIFPVPPAGAEVKIERRLYLAEAEQLLSRFRRIDDRFESVLVIGHNPGLQELAIRLSGRGRGALVARLEAKFPTAALAQITLASRHWADLGSARTRLTGLTTPKEAEGADGADSEASGAGDRHG